ncbi:discoidin domain-containing protein [Streptomyces sp. NPDC020800]|uniref:galactose-binding domain-containing protein n=1 Tax=Streptomyces sp. NPDC020800 TaxID=3365092 RepID=UPI0037B99BB0
MFTLTRPTDGPGNRIRREHARRISRPWAAVATTALIVSGVISVGTTSAASATRVYAAPSGTGTACSEAAPCSIQQAQTTVRGLTSGMTGEIDVVLTGGTYQLTAPLSLSPQDSGNNGYTVVWQAASGEHPVISGGTAVTGWTQTSTPGIWSAPAPAGLKTRQLYANGTRIPRSTATLGHGALAGVSLTQNTAGGFTANSSALASWRNPGDVEFVFPGGNGSWTETRCDVSSIAGTAIKMVQPCWGNLHLPYGPTAPDGDNPSGGFPGLSGNATPTRIENAYELLTPGHWYYDTAAKTVYYDAQAGDNVPAMNFVAPALQQLVTSTGTPTSPVHDLTFSGIKFAYATWLQPSSNDGFAEMQANMTVTGANGSTKQGLCTYISGGTCPFGAWSREPAAVDLVGTRNVSFLGNTFAHLGGAGLGLYHGANSDLVKGNEVFDVSGNGIELGAIDDQQPLDNLALGKTATQSSTGWGGAPSRAVDGNTDGDFNHNSTSHTNADTNAWWKVDLGAVKPLTSVNIWNRTDCCGSRLSDYWLFVSATPFNTALTPAQQAAQPGVWSSHQTTQAATPTTVPANTSGRYVMVQVSGTNYLSLAEVEVSAEVASKNTISDNYIHDIGEEYPSAVGLFGGYTQNTTITHNQISSVPYSGISFGWGGWHTNATTPDTNPSINSDNLISNNLIANAMLKRYDGGPIYTNGPQGTSYAHGLTISGNVTFGSRHTNHAIYNDEGGRYITIDRDVQYQDGASFNGGCSTAGPVTVTNSYHVGALNGYECDNVGAPSQFVDGGGNTTIANNPAPGTVDQTILADAGLEAGYTNLTTTKDPWVNLVSPKSNNRVLISGWGFTPAATVKIGGQTSPSVTYLSSNYLTATVPTGAAGQPLTVTTSSGTSATNLAFNQTATQSSTGWGGAPSRAVDGNTDGDFNHNSTSHTNADTNAWWKVDLGAVKPLTSVNIWNRTDCCGSRLSDYWLFVSATPFNTALTPAQQAAQPGVWSSHQTTQAATPTTVPANTSGRYVMVQLSGTDYLALSEVVVS